MVVLNTAQNSSANLPSYPPDIITVQMLSTEAEVDKDLLQLAV